MKTATRSLFRRIPAGRGSIARRLALLHILTVFVSYTVFCLFLYHIWVGHMFREEIHELAGEIVSLKTIMRQPNGREMLEYEIRGQMFDRDSTRKYIRIVDRQGRTLLETPGMGKVLPVKAFDTIDSSEPFRWRNGEGNNFLLKRTPLPDDVFCGRGCLLEIATNSNDEVDLEQRLRGVLLLVVCGGTVFAFVCAYFIVRTALKPLDDISETARTITQRQLHTRIEEAALPPELVSLAHSFNAMLAHLEEAFQRLSHYSGNLAHELRTPINTLMIAADISLSRERSPEEYRTVLASSLEELGKLAVTIDRMLFLARADIEQPDLLVQEFDAAAEIENVLDFYCESARDGGVTLKSSGCALVHADETLFNRALSNLVSNSLAHTAPGGVISVTCSEGDGGVDVAVLDTGCGIPPEHLSNVFDRFYRVRGAGARTEGTGLGLAIVKAIMQMHGGDVSVRSREGEGTCVTLHFPAVRGAAAAETG